MGDQFRAGNEPGLKKKEKFKIRGESTDLTRLDQKPSFNQLIFYYY